MSSFDETARRYTRGRLAALVRARGRYRVAGESQSARALTRSASFARASSRRTLLAAIPAALAVAALPACRGTGSSLRTVEHAAAATLAQGQSTATTLRGPTALAATGETVVVKGAFALARGFGYAVAGLPLAGHAQPAPAYLVFLPSAIYLEPAAGSASLGTGRSWVALDFGGSHATGGFPRFAEQAEAMNPELLLDEVAWGAASASVVGSPVVDHVPLSEYLVVVDLQRALTAARKYREAAIAAALEEELSALPRARAPLTHVSVWVNGPGLVAQIGGELPGSGLGSVLSALSGFSSKLATNLPLRSTVVPLAALPPAARSRRAPWVLAGAS